MRGATLAATAVRERGLLNQAGMEASPRRARLFARARSARGFSLVEMLMVVAILGILGGIAIGVTPGIINTAKGQSGAQQLAAFLKRHREMAISRRRNIEIRFTLPATVTSSAACRAQSGGRADAAAGGRSNDDPSKTSWSSAASRR